MCIRIYVCVCNVCVCIYIYIYIYHIYTCILISWLYALPWTVRFTHEYQLHAKHGFVTHTLHTHKIHINLRHTYTYTYTCTFTNANIHTDTVYRYTSIHKCTQMHINILMHAHTHTYIHIQMHMLCTWMRETWHTHVERSSAYMPSTYHVHLRRIECAKVLSARTHTCMHMLDVSINVRMHTCICVNWATCTADEHGNMRFWRCRLRSCTRWRQAAMVWAPTFSLSVSNFRFNSAYLRIVSARFCCPSRFCTHFLLLMLNSIRRAPCSSRILFMRAFSSCHHQGKSVCVWLVRKSVHASQRG